MELLSVTGERVFPAVDGEEAWKIFSEKSPRVIVSDWVMPKMDGVELCRRIRACPDPGSAHFIMLTAHGDKARLLDAYQAGVDDFVSKPFDPEEFLAHVRGGVRAAKLRDELIRKATGSQALNSQLAIMNSRLERLSITDELTGLSNRRHGMCRLSEQWDLADRQTQPLTVAMIDIDHFKQINDTYGHDAGDAILKRLAALLRKNTRGVDTICRVGGDEFLVIFPSQTVEEALVCTQRCLQEIHASGLSLERTAIKPTISIGIATRTSDMVQLPDLLKAADQALYAAKTSGRQSVCVANVRTDKSSAQAPDSSANAPIEVCSTQTRAPVDPAALLKRCGGDPKFAAAVTERFRVQALKEVDKIGETLALHDAEGVSRTAHSLKSMAAYMAADRAVELARQIESLGRANDLVVIEPLLTSLRSEIELAIAWINKTAGNKSATACEGTPA